MSDEPAATAERLEALAAALAEVAAAVEQQRQDLRLALEVLLELAAKLEGTEGTALAPTGGGVEVGALMGATQAAWLRLEQRLESEFSDIHRQLRSLTGLTEQATARALEAAERPVVTGAQVRRAASSLRDSMRGLRRPRH